jgi:hypothetical protein
MLWTKACAPCVVAILNWTPIFELYMARLAFKNGEANKEKKKKKEKKRKKRDTVC